MFVELHLWVRSRLARGDSEGLGLAPGEELRVHRRVNPGKVISGVRMEVSTASCCEDTENGHLAYSESSRKAAWRR